MIPYWLDKCQMMIAAEEPPQFGRTSTRRNGWPAALGSTRNASELVSQLKQVVVMATEQIAGMSEAERSKTGVHSTRGALTVAELIESMVVGHAEAHLAQVQAALQGSAN